MFRQPSANFMCHSYIPDVVRMFGRESLSLSSDVVLGHGGKISATGGIGNYRVQGSTHRPSPFGETQT